MFTEGGKVSDSEKVILETIRVELFPVLKKIKDILVRLQACKVFFFTYSPLLPKLEKEYFVVLEELFLIDQKLTTPDILLKDLDDKNEAIVSYFRFQEAFKKNLEEAREYIEIIDRTLDRKRQTLQNNRTLILATAAIIIAVFWK